MQIYLGYIRAQPSYLYNIITRILWLSKIWNINQLFIGLAIANRSAMSFLSGFGITKECTFDGLTKLEFYLKYQNFNSSQPFVLTWVYLFVSLASRLLEASGQIKLVGNSFWVLGWSGGRLQQFWRRLLPKLVFPSYLSCVPLWELVRLASSYAILCPLFGFYWCRWIYVLKLFDFISSPFSASKNKIS